MNCNYSVLRVICLNEVSKKQRTGLTEMHCARSNYSRNNNNNSHNFVFKKIQLHKEVRIFTIAIKLHFDFLLSLT